MFLPQQPLNRPFEPRKRILQDNNAPIGFGQQSGASPFLDNPQQAPEPDARAPLASEGGYPGASGGYRPRPEVVRNQPPFMQALLGDSAPAAAASPTIARAPVTAGRAQVAPVGGMNRMFGYDQTNWQDPDMDSVKYAHGRLANGLTKPSEIAALVRSEAYQQRFPGATFDGKDKINFNGALSDGSRGGVPVGVVDVLLQADAQGDQSNGGAWMPDEVAAAAPPTPEAQAEAERVRRALTQPPSAAEGRININDILTQLMSQQDLSR